MNQILIIRASWVMELRCSIIRKHHVGIATIKMMDKLCTQAHKRDKQVFVNNSWKLHSMKDVDGYFYEFPELRVLSYCAPYRHAAGWHHLKDYFITDDLLQFEANLKQRLKYAIFPHMISRDFKIAQQFPDKEAAAMLEIFAPLFKLLKGKEQVLEAHCIFVSGANEVNLYRNQEDNYIIPVISRLRFLSRRIDATEQVQVKLRTRDAHRIHWAHVYSDDEAPYQAEIKYVEDGIIIAVDRHYSSSVVVAGPGDKPQMVERPDYLNASLMKVSSAPVKPEHFNFADKMQINDVTSAEIRISGEYVDDGNGFAINPFGAERDRGYVSVWVNGQNLGRLSDNNKPGFQGLIHRTEEEQTFAFTLNVKRQLSKNPPVVRLKQVEEESWYAPQKVELWVTAKDGKHCKAAI